MFSYSNQEQIPPPSPSPLFKTLTLAPVLYNWTNGPHWCKLVVVPELDVLGRFRSSSPLISLVPPQRCMKFCLSPPFFPPAKNHTFLCPTFLLQ